MASLQAKSKECSASQDEAKKAKKGSIVVQTSDLRLIQLSEGRLKMSKNQAMKTCDAIMVETRSEKLRKSERTFGRRPGHKRKGSGGTSSECVFRGLHLKTRLFRLEPNSLFTFWQVKKASCNGALLIMEFVQPQAILIDDVGVVTH